MAVNSLFSKVSLISFYSWDYILAAESGTSGKNFYQLAGLLHLGPQV
jgi:hypothetical protein